MREGVGEGTRALAPTLLIVALSLNEFLERKENMSTAEPTSQYFTPYCLSLGLIIQLRKRRLKSYGKDSKEESSLLIKGKEILLKRSFGVSARGNYLLLSPIK